MDAETMPRMQHPANVSGVRSVWAIARAMSAIAGGKHSIGKGGASSAPGCPMQTVAAPLPGL